MRASIFLPLFFTMACLTFSCSRSNMTSCTAPIIAKCIDVGDSTATMTWSPVSGATSYQVHYRILGTTSWTSTLVNSDTIKILHLHPVTRYECQVQTLCPSGSSPYTASAFFYTQGSVPTILDSITGTGAGFQVQSPGSASFKGYSQGDSTVLDIPCGNTTAVVHIVQKGIGNASVNLSNTSGLMIYITADNCVFPYLNTTYSTGILTRTIYGNDSASVTFYGNIYYNTSMGPMVVSNFNYTGPYFQQ